MGKKKKLSAPQNAGDVSDRLRVLEKENARLKRFHHKALTRRRQEQSLKPYQAELIRMQGYLEEVGKKLIIIFEGRDASGKGGTIRRVARYMNEKHYRVVALGKPSDRHKNQWFFQRYVAHLPQNGEVVLFDRSWYNRAVVEPIFEFCTKEQYKEFMRGVIPFEDGLRRSGTIIVKLYFSVSKNEQAHRFARRKNDPLRQWKLSEVDLQAQERWDDFTQYKYRMLRRTSPYNLSWTVIRSDDKYRARLNAMKVILNAVPYPKKKRRGVDLVVDPEIVISGAHEVELMERELVRTGTFIE